MARVVATPWLGGLTDSTVKAAAWLLTVPGGVVSGAGGGPPGAVTEPTMIAPSTFRSVIWLTGGPSVPS